MSGALPSLYVYLCANSRPSCIEIEGLGQRTRTFLRLWSKYPTCAPNLACANSKSAGFIRLLRLFTAAGVHPIFLVRIKPQESSPGCNIHELFRPVLSAQVGYFDQSCENVRLLSALRHVAVPPCPNAARFGVGWTPIRQGGERNGPMRSVLAPCRHFEVRRYRQLSGSYELMPIGAFLQVCAATAREAPRSPARCGWRVHARRRRAGGRVRKASS